jgi:hypothetical protein
MGRHMVNTGAFYRSLNHLSNVFDTITKATGFRLGKNPWRL